ncbi:MAG: hypothetical protein GEU78_02530 [Actinobacteria bacterium]|nr:hypothetical protein [Actinomycetota bacterium]
MAWDVFAAEQGQAINWPTFLTAAAALITAVIAGVAVWVEGHRLRRQIGIDNMWRLIEQWEGPAFRERRCRAATSLLERFPAGTHDVPLEVMDVLNTFELLGYLVLRSKTLPLEDAWINFSAPAIQWWHVCRPIVLRFQEGDKTIYEDYTRLAGKLIEEEVRRTGLDAESLKPSAHDLQEFLRAEVALVPKARKAGWLRRRRGEI